MNACCRDGCEMNMEMYRSGMHSLSEHIRETDLLYGVISLITKVLMMAVYYQYKVTLMLAKLDLHC